MRRAKLDDGLRGADLRRPTAGATRAGARSSRASRRTTRDVIAGVPRRARRVRAHQQEPLRRHRAGRRPLGVRRVRRHRRRARRRPASALGVPVVHVVRGHAARRAVRDRDDLRRRAACTRRTASSAARAGKHVVCEKPMAITLAQRRRARARLRRRRRAAVRREAESPQPAGAAAEARDRQGAVRPDLPREHDGALDAAAGVLRPGAVARARGSSTAARS